MIRRPPRSPLFPSTTLSRSQQAPPVPEFVDTDGRLVYLRWLAAMSDRLWRRKPEWLVRKEFLQTVWYESRRDRKSTRLNSSHSQISYAVFCLKKKKKITAKHRSTKKLHVSQLHTTSYSALYFHYKDA